MILTPETITILLGKEDEIHIALEDLGDTQLVLKVAADPARETPEDQARLMVNQDLSCWIEQKSSQEPTELLRPGTPMVSRLAKEQIARLQSGDLIGVRGNYFRLNMEGNKITLSGAAPLAPKENTSGKTG